MNLMQKMNGKIEEKIINLFAICLPYKTYESEKVPIVCKEVPKYNETPITDKWVLIISKESWGAEALEELKINECVTEVYKLMKKNPPTSIFWFDLMVKSWMQYFYPEIYMNAWTTIEKPKEAIGFYPYCPPTLHVKD